VILTTVNSESCNRGYLKEKLKNEEIQKGGEQRNTNSVSSRHQQTELQRDQTYEGTNDKGPYSEKRHRCPEKGDRKQFGEKDRKSRW